MPEYRWELVDHGGNVRATEYFTAAADPEAIKAAHRMHVPGIGNGFDLWHGERHIHRHRDSA